jgi:hypothetical protein
MESIDTAHGWSMNLENGERVQLLHDVGESLAGEYATVVEVTCSEMDIRTDRGAEIGYSIWEGQGEIHRWVRRGDESTFNDPQWCPTPDQIDALVSACRYEILDDMESGEVPGEEVASFTDLHDHVDANMYGVRYVTRYSRSRSDAAGIDLMNAAHDVLDPWLARRRIAS